MVYRTCRFGITIAIRCENGNGNGIAKRGALTHTVGGNKNNKRHYWHCANDNSGGNGGRPTPKCLLRTCLEASDVIWRTCRSSGTACMLFSKCLIPLKLIHWMDSSECGNELDLFEFRTSTEICYGTNENHSGIPEWTYWVRLNEFIQCDKRSGSWNGTRCCILIAQKKLRRQFTANPL